MPAVWPIVPKPPQRLRNDAGLLTIRADLQLRSQMPRSHVRPRENQLHLRPVRDRGEASDQGVRDQKGFHLQSLARVHPDADVQQARGQQPEEAETRSERGVKSRSLQQRKERRSVRQFRASLPIFELAAGRPLDQRMPRPICVRVVDAVQVRAAAFRLYCPVVCQLR